MLQKVELIVEVPEGDTPQNWDWDQLTPSDCEVRHVKAFVQDWVLVEDED